MERRTGRPSDLPRKRNPDRLSLIARQVGLDFPLGPGSSKFVEAAFSLSIMVTIYTGNTVRPISASDGSHTTYTPRWIQSPAALAHFIQCIFCISQAWNHHVRWFLQLYQRPTWPNWHNRVSMTASRSLLRASSLRRLQQHCLPCTAHYLRCTSAWRSVCTPCTLLNLLVHMGPSRVSWWECKQLVRVAPKCHEHSAPSKDTSSV